MGFDVTLKGATFPTLAKYCLKVGMSAHARFWKKGKKTLQNTTKRLSMYISHLNLWQTMANLWVFFLGIFGQQLTASAA